MSDIKRLSHLAPVIGLAYQQLAALAERPDFPRIRARQGVIRLYDCSEVLDWHAAFVQRRNRTRTTKSAIFNTAPIIDGPDSLIDPQSTDH
ncbi:hypothetical protein ASD45_19145 [Pseudolabrys sp. Root1462]|nr:hypothetical protein ASD45_19145 [Pseudolabrys sp. Root1462]